MSHSHGGISADRDAGPEVVELVLDLREYTQRVQAVIDVAVVTCKQVLGYRVKDCALRDRELGHFGYMLTQWRIAVWALKLFVELLQSTLRQQAQVNCKASIQ
jgi:hypothetical protein